jgi:nitrate reductase gamma subunit
MKIVNLILLVINQVRNIYKYQIIIAVVSMLLDQWDQLIHIVQENNKTNQVHLIRVQFLQIVLKSKKLKRKLNLKLNFIRNCLNLLKE